MKHSRAYEKGYKAGYNNPGHFDQTKLLACNTDTAKGAVDGICQRKTDQANDINKFIFT